MFDASPIMIHIFAIVGAFVAATVVAGLALLISEGKRKWLKSCKKKSL